MAGLFFICLGALLLVMGVILVANCLDDRRVRALAKLNTALLVEKGISGRWQAAAEYILSQEGDDLCWRDFYVELGKCLPDAHPLKDLAKLKSLPSGHIMMRNCRRFISSLEMDTTYKPFTGEPLTQEKATVQPMNYVEVMLGVDRCGLSPSRCHRASVSFSPPEYASSERFQLLVSEQMNRLIEAIDKEERGDAIPSNTW